MNLQVKTRSVHSRLFERISLFTALLVTAGGCTVLTGWIFGIPFLQSILPKFVTMKVNTAICFMLIGLSLLLWDNKSLISRFNIGLTHISAFIVFVMGTLTIFEYVSGLNIGIDQFIIQERALAILTSHLGRMAINTAINFTLISTAILLMRVEKIQVIYLTQLIAIISGYVALLALTGYFYGASPLILGEHYSTAMAIHTSVLFIAVSISFIFARPGLGVMNVISNDSTSGKLVRNMLPIAILTPLLLGWLKILAYNYGIISNEMGVAFVAILNLTITSVYIYIIAAFAYRSEKNRTKNEAELKLRNIILSTQQEASIDGILIIDEKGAIISYNRRFTDMWNIPAEVIESKSDERALQCVMHRLEKPEEFIEKVKYLYEFKNESSRDDIILKGNVVFDRYSAPMLDAEGNYYGRVWYFRDITERKSMEAENEIINNKLMQSQKMAAIGQLAGGVAHEINNPLTVILGFAQVELINANKGSALYASLEAIERESLRCKKIVSDLLLFSRDWKNESMKADISAVVERAMQLIEPLIKSKKIEIVKNYEVKLPESLMNPDRIQQVIVNLVSNAADAIAVSGKICITTKLAGNQLQIDVSDNGEGMSENVKKHLFEPFFSTKKQGQGTGLGLSLCREIVSKHKGTIDVKSEPGTGTTVSVMLPVDK